MNTRKKKSVPLGRAEGIATTGKNKKDKDAGTKKRLKSKGSSGEKENKKELKFKGLSLVKEEIELELHKFAHEDLKNLDRYSYQERVVILQNELINQIKVADDYKETLQRVAADLDNYRKRSEKEKKDIIRYANGTETIKPANARNEKFLDNNKRIDVTFTIEEGERFYIRKIAAPGDDIFLETDL